MMVITMTGSTRAEPGLFLTLRRLALLAGVALAAGCSSSPSPTEPTTPPLQPVSLTLVQGETAVVTGLPVRLAFDAVIEPCNDVVIISSCLPSAYPERQFRIAVDGGAFVPLSLQQIGSERRFQGQAGGYLVFVEGFTVQAPGEWVASVVVRRGLEL